MFSRRSSWAQRREGAVGSQGRVVVVAVVVAVVGVFSMVVICLV